MWVELDGLPEIRPLGTVTGRITVKNLRMQPAKHYHLRWLLPEGWSVSCKSNLSADVPWSVYRENASAAFTITAGDTVAPNNRLVLEVSVSERPTCVYVPIMLLG